MLQESFILSYFILLHVRYADGIAVGERQGQCWISGDGEASCLCLGIWRPPGSLCTEFRNCAELEATLTV